MGLMGTTEDQIEWAVHYLLTCLPDMASGEDTTETLDFVRRRVDRELLFEPDVSNATLQAAVGKVETLLRDPRTFEALARFRALLANDTGQPDPR